MKRFTALLMSVGVGAILTHASIAAPLNYEDYPIIKLRSLDKITARTMNFEAKVGSTIRFGDIFIKVQACRKPPPIEKNEAAAFLQIYQANESAPDEKDGDTKSSWIFSGWMFASSPAISAMDHPIYDVWVLDCLGRDPEPLPPPEQQAAEAEVKEDTEKEIPENKEQNIDGMNNHTPANNAVSPPVTNTDSHIPSETKTETITPTPSNEQPAPIPSDTSQSDEPSVDEMLQPEKATTQSGTQNDDDMIYSPPKPTQEQSPESETPNIPDTSQDNPVPQNVTPVEPTQNPSSELDGIY